MNYTVTRLKYIKPYYSEIEAGHYSTDTSIKSRVLLHIVIGADQSKTFTISEELLAKIKSEVGEDKFLE